MKKLFFLSLFITPLCAAAQFVVGTQGLTIQNGAVFTIDSLVLQPSADVTITSNQLQRSVTSVPIGSGASINRIYSFTSPVNFTGTVGIKYQDAELGGNMETGLRLTYSSSGTGSVWVTTTGSMVNPATNYVSLSVTNKPLARITATSNSAPLPVSLLDFNARKDEVQHRALLSWEIANEANVASYLVTRSNDGRTFSTLGSVNAQMQKHYSFTDAQPMQGMNYYRLEMMEPNGNASYSAVRSLAFGDKTTMVDVFPNPVTAGVTIHTNDVTLSGASGVVIDVTGKTILSFVLSGTETTLTADAWIAGPYLIRLSNGSVFKIEKR